MKMLEFEHQKALEREKTRSLAVARNLKTEEVIVCFKGSKFFRFV